MPARYNFDWLHDAAKRLFGADGHGSFEVRCTVANGIIVLVERLPGTEHEKRRLGWEQRPPGIVE